MATSCTTYRKHYVRFKPPAQRQLATEASRSSFANGGGRRQLIHRLTDDQVRELVAAFEAGTTRMELAKRYGIGRTSVATLLRNCRNSQKGTA